jgi:predicted Ser/Thr protein kinase
MRQEMMEHEYSRALAESKTPETTRPRALTYDEKKAAEAAFRGEPFNSAWSAAAARVYSGIVSAMEKRRAIEPADSDVAAECTVG